MTAEPGSGSEATATTDGPARPPIRIRYRSNLRDSLRTAAYAGRRSDVMFAFGVLGVAGGALLLYLGEPVTAVVGLLIGAAALSGWWVVPIQWWAARQQPALLGAEIEDVIDDTGISETAPTINAHIDWAMYKDVAETRRGFYLSTGTGMGFIPRTAFSDDQLAELRRIVSARGLWRRPHRLRRVVTLAVVSAVILGLTFGPIFVNRLTASPRIDLAPSVEGEVVRLRATTDLPDGAVLTLEIVQLDEYSTSVAGGAPADSTNPWVRWQYVNVTRGTAEAVFEPDWPAGRGRAMAFFEPVLQPAHVSARYGSAGQQLSGAFVVDEPGRDRFVRVVADFELP